MGRKVSGSLKNREPFCAPQKENPCKFMTYKGLSFLEVVWGEQSPFTVS
jgi:hypothetical protein